MQAIPHSVSMAAQIIYTAKTTIINLVEKISTRLFKTHQSHSSFIPWPILNVTVVAIIGISYWKFSHYRSSPSVQATIVRARDFFQKDADRKGDAAIHSFVQDLFRSSAFRKTVGAAGCNEEMAVFLTNKLILIIRRETSSEGMAEIIDVVLRNFPAFISTAQARINTDIQNGTLGYLDIDQDDKIIKILPLGAETHNQGKIPLRIIFHGGKSIVYKPRSMLPEQLICDQKNGILAQENFGTYRVVGCVDGFGEDYGYSDFLENIPEKNTASTHEEVSEYIRKLCILEKISTILGLSDLHYMNIITDHLEPKIIDAEVFLSFPHTQSGLFNKVDGAAVIFDYGLGKVPGLVGKNRIWFAPTLTAGIDCNFDHRMTTENLAKIGIDIDEIMKRVELRDETRKASYCALHVLQKYKGRFVLEGTAALISIQNVIDPQNIDTFEYFLKSIERLLEEQGFLLHERSIETLLNGALIDARNNDIPIFYYHSETKALFYHGVVIGTRP